jgi:hypothetical protein
VNNGVGFNLAVIFAGQFGLNPQAVIAKQARDERGVHCVSGAVGHNARDQALADEREVSNAVEDFVADELVAETQRAVLNSIRREHDHAFVGGAADQPLVAHGFFLLQEPERARASNLGDETSVGKLDGERLITDQRMREVDGVLNREAVCRVDADELVAIAKLERLDHAQVLAMLALAAKSGGEDHVDEGLGAAIEDGELEVVELDDRVVESGADNGGQQVLGGGDEHSALHQAGCVADFGDVATVGLDEESVEIDAPKDNAGTGVSREDPQGDRSAGMKTNAGTESFRPDCLFTMQNRYLPPIE